MNDFDVKIKTIGYLEKLDFSSNIEASRIFYHRYIVDITRIKNFG